MLFSKKNKKEIKCESCGKKGEDKFSFCPYCGDSLIDEAEELENYGLLGKNDARDAENLNNPFANPSMGITDKLIGSIMDSMMKNLNKQLKEIDRTATNTEIATLPNGVKIRIGTNMIPQQNQNKPAKRSPDHPKVTEEQMQRMAELPRAQAKSSVKRFANKIIYELSTPGVVDIRDVLVSKLESGYEIKAIGEKKVYSNSIPVNLPLKQITLEKSKLLVEFLPNQQ